MSRRAPGVPPLKLLDFGDADGQPDDPDQVDDAVGDLGQVLSRVLCGKSGSNLTPSFAE